jgi:hypothetical protein
MNGSATDRQQVIEMVNTLPDEVLAELVSFIDYLRYKTSQPPIEQQGSTFLLSIAGLGHSGERDISERDEKI